jgi:hypothetical protein
MPRRATRPAAILAIIVMAGCSNPPPSPSPSTPGSVAAAASPSAATSASPGGTAAQIPQPSVSGVEVADLADRVDLAMPTFSHPTEITNPLFPIALQSSELLVGTVEKKAFRTEVTVLPWTQVIEWEGRQIETVVSQYNAFLDGRIEEIAYDLYAQADDGSVWYFGENVFNFADGSIADTGGTWHAGIDGPAAMIMPADPQVGDVYRTENAPGFVFEEVTVSSVSETLDGPLGPIDGGMLASELHMDGATEDKVFAPGYGEFNTSGGGDVEALAMAVPTDTASGSQPDALASAAESATTAVQAALDGDLSRVEQLASDLDSAMSDLGEAEIPALLRPLLADGIDSLSTAASDGEQAAATRAAIDVARLVNDLTLRYRPIPEVNLDRIGLWGAQLILHAGAENLEGIRSDNFAVDYARERIVGGVPDEIVNELNTNLEELQLAMDDEDFAAIAETAQAIRDLAGDIGS